MMGRNAQCKPLGFKETFQYELDPRGVATLELQDRFRDWLGEKLSNQGYITKDEDAHIARNRRIFAAWFDNYAFEMFVNLSNRKIGCGIVQFNNYPYERVSWSPVPGWPAHSAKDTSLSEHGLMGTGSIFGELYGVEKEGRRLVNDLCPKREAVDLYTGEGSRKKLGLHYENAALRFAKPGLNLSPKGLLLTGVSRQRVGGPKTVVAIASQACARLPQEAYDILRAHCTYIKLPVRQRVDNAGRTKVGPVPVILGAGGREEVVAAFYGDMMEPVDAKAEWALGLLEEALNQVAFGIAVEPGTMVYLANGPVLHGRDSFDPIFDERGRAQRWLQRVFVCDRLDVFNECRAISDRVFDVQL